MHNTAIQISEKLLLAVKMNESYIELLEALKKLSFLQLKSQVNTGERGLGGIFTSSHS